MTAVVGMDTASSRFHVSTTDPALPVFWFEDADPNPDIRRIRLHFAARRFFDQLPEGSSVFCEEPLALQNGKTTVMLSLAAGAIWAAHLECDLIWHWVPVSTWKKRIVLNGNASKKRVAAHVREEGGELPMFEEEPDLYDAWCLRKYGELVLRELSGLEVGE